MLSDWVGAPLAALRDASVERLARAGVRPNTLTLCGLAVSLVAAGAAATGRFVTTGCLLLLAGIFDALDGTIARRTNQSSPFGAFLDSVMDRYADLTVLLGLVLHYASADVASGPGWGNLPLVLTAGAILGSALTPYARARAESLIAACKVGVAERPERLILLVVGLVFDRMVPALGAIAVLSNVTVLQRLFYVRRVLHEKPDDRAVVADPHLLSPFEEFLYWTYPRGTLPFDVLCVLLLLLIVFA